MTCGPLVYLFGGLVRCTANAQDSGETASNGDMAGAPPRQPTLEATADLFIFDSELLLWSVHREKKHVGGRIGTDGSVMPTRTPTRAWSLTAARQRRLWPMPRYGHSITTFPANEVAAGDMCPISTTTTVTTSYLICGGAVTSTVAPNAAPQLVPLEEMLWVCRLSTSSRSGSGTTTADCVWHRVRLPVQEVPLPLQPRFLPVVQVVRLGDGAACAATATATTVSGSTALSVTSTAATATALAAAAEAEAADGLRVLLMVAGGTERWRVAHDPGSASPSQSYRYLVENWLAGAPPLGTVLLEGYCEPLSTTL